MAVEQDTPDGYKIPIRNIWWMMLYASDFSNIRDDLTRKFGTEENPKDLPDMVAQILICAVRRRLLRNLSADLERMQDDLGRVRGSINHIRTNRHFLLERGMIACTFDHFTANTPKNQYVKAALDKLGRIVNDVALRRRCRAYAAALEGAGVIDNISAASIHKMKGMSFNAARLHPEDRRMLAAARLALDMLLPTEDAGRLHLPTIHRKKRWLEQLFEKAIGGFYCASLPRSEWTINSGKWIHWNKKSPTPLIGKILPDMQTDIILEKSNKTGVVSRTIIDTKFQNILTTGRWGENKLCSTNLYQLYAYLRSQELESDPASLCSSGLLLHPSLGVDVDEAVTIQKHRIRFATVNLAESSTEIRNNLLKLFLVN